MANPTCTAKTLVTDAAPYQRNICGSPETQQCLLILGMVYELAGIGGTDYRVNGAPWTQLLTDAQQLEIGESEDQLMAGMINLQFVKAAAVNPTPALPNTLAGQLAQLGQLVNTDPLLLDKIQLLLFCKLGVHKSFPQ